MSNRCDNTKPDFQPVIHDNTYIIEKKSTKNKYFILESHLKQNNKMEKVVEAPTMLKRQNAKISLKVTNKRSKIKRRISSSNFIKINPKDILSSTRHEVSFSIQQQSPLFSSTIKTKETKNKKRKTLDFNEIRRQRKEIYYSKCCCSKRNPPTVVYNNPTLPNDIYTNTSFLVDKNAKFNNFGDFFVWYV
jgi:hypothetical protein